MHELLTLEEIISDVGIRMTIEVIAQKLKINHIFSLDVVVCPFLKGM
jgi:hypothetical protein